MLELSGFLTNEKQANTGAREVCDRPTINVCITEGVRRAARGFYLRMLWQMKKQQGAFPKEQGVTGNGKNT